MHAPVFSDSQLPSANRPSSNRTALLAVHLHGFGKLPCRNGLLHVEDVTRTCVSFVVNQVNGAAGMHGGLRLNAAIGSAQCCDFRCSQSETEACEQDDENGWCNLETCFHF